MELASCQSRRVARRFRCHTVCKPSVNARRPHRRHHCQSHLRRASAKQQPSQLQLYERTRSARRLRSAGLALSCTVLALGGGTAVRKGVIALPDIDYVAATAVTVAALALVAGSLWNLHKGLVSIEWHDGRFWTEVEVPPLWVPAGPSLPPGSVQVRDTGSVRGNGAYAAADIAKGAHIADYEGELLDLRHYYDRYPDGVSDYCMGLDDEWALDGSARATDTAAFSGCHINHARKRYNVVRRTRRADHVVELFASRDIRAGEELLLDYGAGYWEGREDLELP